MNAREEVLRRVRAATADVAEKDPNIVSIINNLFRETTNLMFM